MIDGWLDWLVDPAGLTPHGFCLLWDPWLIWTHALSDGAIGLAYFVISAGLAVFARRRRDLVFRPVFALFAAFILLCGAGHWLELLTLWVPAYGVEAVEKAATAVVSVITAIALWPLLPRAMALPSPVQLEAANLALRESEARLHQVQKMEAVGQLTGGIAHDFNNMLQGVGGCLELIERRLRAGRTEEVMRHVVAALQAVDRAAGLIHRMLAFARRQALQPAPVDPDSLVRGMADLIGRTVGPAIRLDLALGDGQWRALCDANQLESALLNLAINARDAMPEGGTILIRTAERRMTAADLRVDEAAPGDYVEIALLDQGVGMTPEVQARAFEPFFTTKPVGVGTGLGLSQLYGFVQQSGGFVRLESAPGRGTAISLYLPRHAGPVEDSPAAAKPVPPGGRFEAIARFAGVPARLLVVEDDDAGRALIGESLRDRRYDVLEAADGLDGLRLLQSDEAFDLMVTDIGLPGVNGRQLAEAARLARPGLPVLLITGDAGAALKDWAVPPGMRILRKPFSLELLVDTIGAMLAPQTVPAGPEASGPERSGLGVR